MARPLKIDQVVAQRDGKPVTAGQQVIERMRALWMPWEDVAASAGITRQTLHSWRRAGGLARAKEAQGGKLTRKELGLARFLDDLESAEAEAEAHRLGIIQGEAKGGYTVEKTTTTTRQAMQPDGTIVTLTSTVTTTETARPVWQAAAWQLERRRPQKYGKRVELVGAGGEPLIPTEERASQLGDSLEAYLRGIGDVVDARSIETNGKAKADD